MISVQVCECDIREKTHEIIERYETKRGILVPILQDVQRELGYLPEAALKIVSEELNLTLSHVCGVASFYTNFYFTPRGDNIIKVCIGTACHVRGARKMLDEFEDELGIKDSETTEDLAFTLETVSCVGCCALAPVVTINDKVSRVRKAKKAIETAREIAREAELDDKKDE